MAGFAYIFTDTNLIFPLIYQYFWNQIRSRRQSCSFAETVRPLWTINKQCIYNSFKWERGDNLHQNNMNKKQQDNTGAKGPTGHNKNTKNANNKCGSSFKKSIAFFFQIYCFLLSSWSTVTSSIFFLSCLK